MRRCVGGQKTGLLLTVSDLYVWIAESGSFEHFAFPWIR